MLFVEDAFALVFDALEFRLEGGICYNRGIKVSAGGRFWGRGRRGRRTGQDTRDDGYAYAGEGCLAGHEAVLCSGCDAGRVNGEKMRSWET